MFSIWFFGLNSLPKHLLERSSSFTKAVGNFGLRAMNARDFAVSGSSKIGLGVSFVIGTGRRQRHLLRLNNTAASSDRCNCRRRGVVEKTAQGVGRSQGVHFPVSF